MIWVFLAFVVLLSGVVSYAADTIARKVGRKHLRWFGLRPKATALVVAVLAGMGISVASLTAFLLLNKNAVDVIAEADRVRPQLEALRLEVRAVQAERDRAQRAAVELSARQAQAERTLATTRNELEAARQATTRVRNQAATLQKRIAGLNTTIAALEKREQENRQRLVASAAALKASQERAQRLDAQVLDFRQQTALAQYEAQSAQERADGAQRAAEGAEARARQAEAAARTAGERADAARRAADTQTAAARAQVVAAQGQVAAAQGQATTLREQLGDVRKQIADLEQSRQNAQQELATARQAAQVALDARQVALDARAVAEQQRLGALKARDALSAERNRLAAERDKLTLERNRLAAERNRLAAERDRAAQERDRVRDDLGALQQQQLALKKSNDALARDLATTRSTLGKLQDEYTSSREELNASRNTDLAYPKNELVYAAVVPSVRNLDRFLQDASRAAQSRGAKGTPAARLGTLARAGLETKLRGLNASTFVQCRAAQNAALGFPVDLSCDARANGVLYRGDQVIRRATVTLGGDSRAMQAQINDLVRDAVEDITSRGVPDEYVLNQGLDVSELVNLLGRLSARSDGTAVVGIAARDDVRPSTRVDLYPVLP